MKSKTKQLIDPHCTPISTLQYDQIYRGYQWKITPSRIYAICWWQPTGATAKLGNFIAGANLRLFEFISSVHKHRQALRPMLQPMIAFDRVPWELHEIEDEAAYNAALAAYKANA